MTTTPDPVIDILIEDERWDVSEALTHKVLLRVLQHLNLKTPYEISVVLTNDDSIQALNKQYRDKDKATNVLSFPQDDEILLGDVILAFETISREAKELDKSFEDHFQHLLVHGLLHLLGYDHETDEEAAEMEGLETEICVELGLDDPYKTNDNADTTVA